MVSERRSMTLLSVANTSLRNPRFRISFQNLFNRIHFRCIWRNVQKFNIVRNVQSTSLMPCCTIAAQQNNVIGICIGQFSKEYVHASSIALWKNQKEMIPGKRLHCPKGIIILPDMMAGHTGANTSFTPAVFWLVDSAKASFILEHQPNCFSVVDNFQFFDSGLNFFEAAMVSSSAFLGCLLRGMTLRQPCRCRTK